MRLGYYFVDGRYGDYFHEANGYTTIHRAGLWDSSPPDAPHEEAVYASLSRARMFNKQLCLALDINYWGAPHWQDVLDRMPDDLLVALDYVELADEPRWGQQEAADWAGAVRTILQQRGGKAKLGVTLFAEQILRGEAWFYRPQDGYAYVGVECYDPPGMSDATVAAYLKKLVAEVHPNSERWVVGQSYNLGGTWVHRDVVDLQWPIARAAEKVGAKALVWFAYGRPGGVISNRRLAARHKEIYAEFGGGL